jgi:hypothetical protein
VIGRRAIDGMSCAWCEWRTRRVSVDPREVGGDGWRRQTPALVRVHPHWRRRPRTSGDPGRRAVVS